MQVFYNKKDRNLLPDGVWNEEPDKGHWIYKGLDCLIVRNNLGALCGYVGVPKGHRLYEMDYDDANSLVDAYWGLTFANKCNPNADPTSSICHPLEGAANEDVWWLGFDCAHCDDFIPCVEYPNFGETVYKDFVFVQKGVHKLADGIVELNK